MRDSLWHIERLFINPAFQVGMENFNFHSRLKKKKTVVDIKKERPVNVMESFPPLYAYTF